MRILGALFRSWWIGFSLLAFLVSACRPAAVAAHPDLPVEMVPNVADLESTDPEQAIEIFPTLTLTDRADQAAPTKAEPVQGQTASEPTQTETPPALVEASGPPASATPTSALVETHSQAAEDWKSWPVIPQVPEAVIPIYQQGLALGNDPHAFSILGDCQSLAETFMGVYDSDPTLVAGLPGELQAVIKQFGGSFDRLSPTVKGGTTAGAVLWSAWHENEYTCQANETPLACELRLHNPSIMIINLGTHYETRNITYLRKILDQLIEQGVVPVLSTKADNREMDDRLNLEMAQLAVEYNLPLWNFYAAVSDLPNHGVGIKAGDEHLGEIYLSEEGLERHRYTALQALAAVWSVLQQP